MTDIPGKSTHHQTRAHNVRLVLKTIYDKGRVSRAGVARLTGLTRVTVSEIVLELMEKGLVSEVGRGSSTGGKSPILLSVVDDAYYLIGIDLANSEFRGAVVDLRGKILHRLVLPIKDRDGEVALNLVYTLVGSLLKMAERPVLGIGIGTPGLMDPYRGVVINAVNLDWHDLPLADLLNQRFQLPVHVANDSQVAAWAEYTFNNRDKRQNLILVKIGRGVGAGIVLDGKLFYGDNFGAGEIGHMVIASGGERCRCGNYGCLETLVSSRAVLRRVRVVAERDPLSLLHHLALQGEITSDLVFQVYEDGDETIQKIVEEAGHHLGVAVAHMVSVLNINQVVLAGSVTGLGDRLVKAVKRQVEQAVLPALAEKTTIGISSLGRDIVILGAAGLILSQEVGVI